MINGDSFTANNCLNSSILLWIPRCAKTPPTSLIVELSSEQQTSHPNQFILPIVTLLIPFGSTIFWISFAWAGVGFHVTLANELPSSICSFSLVPHDVLGLGLGRYSNKYVKSTSFYVKESSFNWYWWKICRCSTSASQSNFSSLYVAIISICSSSSKSLIITIVV